jgi:glutaredoxin|tara:strand:- start:735 stop:1010 length:276 start_codon:yes stop_codon:yes gene_type:complete
MVNYRYIVFGRSDCNFCCLALDFCEAKGIESLFLDFKDNREILEDYKDFYNHPTVPIILANNLETGHTRKLGGYKEFIEEMVKQTNKKEGV